MNKSLVVIAAHPDDEMLGCGGSLLKFRSLGYAIHLLYMTDGVSARAGTGKSQQQVRSEGLAAFLKELAPASHVAMDFPDNRMDSVPLLDVAQACEKVIARVQPEIVLTHFPGDLNIDHKITFQAVMTACRPLPNFSVKKILCFEVLSSTEWSADKKSFEPNYFVDISDFIDGKMKLAKCYESEMRAAPHSRSLEHVKTLAAHRGASVGVNYAEAFQVIREIF